MYTFNEWVNLNETKESGKYEYSVRFNDKKIKNLPPMRYPPSTEPEEPVYSTISAHSKPFFAKSLKSLVSQVKKYAKDYKLQLPDDIQSIMDYQDNKKYVGEELKKLLGS